MSNGLRRMDALNTVSKQVDAQIKEKNDQAGTVPMAGDVPAPVDAMPVATVEHVEKPAPEK